MKWWFMLIWKPQIGKYADDNGYSIYEDIYIEIYLK